ncbi:hypothetical protein HPB49_007368 [Dermacentor silvarum]|uniref:Uncharacterized protein n=1 Tax=Dermacentor silvarum TaxID=543639 RepID=A0ACB8DBP5_DERSI|nr:hypothetical protein HPB49_007368 [Dermacentor silvarum]
MGKMERPENRAPTQATDRSGVTSETVASKPVKEQQEPCFHRSALLLAHRGGVHGRPRSLALPRELAINVVAKNPQQLGTPGSSKRAGPSRASILKQNPAPLIVDEIDAAEETVTTSFPGKATGSSRQHLRIHTGERPFPCPECGKRFGSSANLRQHRKTHDNHRLEQNRHELLVKMSACDQPSSKKGSEEDPAESEDEAPRPDTVILVEMDERDESSNGTEMISGQPSPQTLLAQISASVLVKNEGQDGEVVPGEILVHEVAPDDVMPSEVVPDEALEVAAEVMEAASSELEPTDAVETILVPDEAVEEVQQVEDITAEVMASAGVTVDNTVLCKVEPCEKSSEIWVLGDIITVDEQAHCILAEHVAAGASSTDTEALLGGPKHACVDCGKEFTTVFHLRRHRRIHTGERPYPCKVRTVLPAQHLAQGAHAPAHWGGALPVYCLLKDLQGSSQLQELEISVRAVTIEQQEGDAARYDKLSMVSAISTMKFTTTMAPPSMVHQNSHSKERPYACRVCEKRFNAASTLYAHMKIHTGERPYACTICNRSFTFNNTLVRHIRTHTGEKPYKCELCPLRFSTASNLSSHRKKHSQERQFHCEICPQEFSTATALASHVKTHTGEHAHQCEVCSRGFAKFAGLQAHMRKHTGERAFYCSECGKGFTRKLHLKQHPLSTSQRDLWQHVKCVSVTLSMSSLSRCT